MWIPVVLVDYIVKEIYPVDAQLNCNDYDGSYMFRLRTEKLCTDRLYFFHSVVYKLNRAAKPKITNTISKLRHIKNLVVKSTMFPHRNIHKYTWNSPDGKTHNQIDHVLIDRRWHSSVLDVRSFRRADFDTDHYLVIAKCCIYLRV